MLTALNNIILKIADPLLGWLLWLPTDAALILVSVATGAALTFARRLTTNQDLLRRCRKDKERLKQLIKQAKRDKDKQAVQRYGASLGAIMLKKLKSEGLPLLLAIVPVAILAVWCFFRLEFHPPKTGQTVPVYAYFPISAAGNLVHMVPQKGVTDEDGWIKEIAAVTDPAEGPPHGMAEWQLKAEANVKPYTLEIRHKGGTSTKQLLVGQRTYAPSIEFYTQDGPIICTEVKMKQVKLFGVVPGDMREVPLLRHVPYIRELAVAPWLVAYFLIAIPSVPLIKWVTRIY